MRPEAFRHGALRRNERGHLMVALVAAIAIMLIFSSMAFQAWGDLVRRDNEAEMMFRAQDIVRAIQRYRRDHGMIGPEKLEDLMEAGPRGQYYLRKLYTDPLVRGGKWGLLYMGPNGTLIDPTAPPPEIAAEGLQITPMQSKLKSKSKPEGEPSTAPGSGLAGGLDAGGQAVGGLRLAGVKSLCKDQPFRVYRGFSDYSEWRFSFYDLEAQQTNTNTTNPGTNTTTPTTTP